MVPRFPGRGPASKQPKPVKRGALLGRTRHDLPAFHGVGPRWNQDERASARGKRKKSWSDWFAAWEAKMTPSLASLASNSCGCAAQLGGNQRRLRQLRRAACACEWVLLQQVLDGCAAAQRVRGAASCEIRSEAETSAPLSADGIDNILPCFGWGETDSEWD